MASQKSQQKNINKSYKEQEKMINSAYGAAQSLYDQQLNQIAQFQPEYEQTITAGYEAQRPILQQQATMGLENVSQQKEATRSARETALSGARRQYEEGLQRSQQLFGGVAGSSAGQASAEYLGAQTQRSMGQARQQSEQALMSLGATERDINATLTNKLAELEVTKTRALTQARDMFRSEINTIQNQKGVLAINKANAQIQALQDFNTRRQNLDQYYRQQQDSLKNYAEQSKMDLQKYEQQLGIQSRYPQLFQSGSSSTKNIPTINSDLLSDPARAKNYVNNLLTTYSNSELLNAGVLRDRIKDRNNEERDVVFFPGNIVIDRNNGQLVTQ
jgi:hypothetical protein